MRGNKQCMLKSLFEKFKVHLRKMNSWMDWIEQLYLFLMWGGIFIFSFCVIILCIMDFLKGLHFVYYFVRQKCNMCVCVIVQALKCSGVFGHNVKSRK